MRTAGAIRAQARGVTDGRIGSDGWFGEFIVLFYIFSNTVDSTFTNLNRFVSTLRHCKYTNTSLSALYRSSNESLCFSDVANSQSPFIMRFPSITHLSPTLAFVRST